jgi:CheY-like chemotaxis protein
MTRQSSASPAGAEQLSARPTIPPAGTGSLRIFHVHDSTDDQVLFQAACRKGGIPFDWHVVDSAEKGISYLRALVEHSREVPVCWPDLVLLDIVMPMVSGFEVLNYIRETPELKHLPVIVFTGHSFPKHREDSLKFGADAFLLKPQDFTAAVNLARELYALLQKLRGGTGA